MLVTYTNTQTDLSDNTGWYRYYANVQKDYGTSPRDLYSEEACTSCHGGKIFNRGLSSALDADGAPRRSTRGYHFATVNGENCSVCHSYSGKNSSNPNDGGNLVTYVHGVHVSEPDSTVDVTSGVTYGISYPNNMKDCVVCHNSSERLTEVTSQKYFNYFTCMSCHQSWNSWDLVGEQVADVAFHAAYTGATDELACASCHNGGLAPTFAEFHGEGDMTATKKLGSLFRYAVDSVTIGAGTADVVWYVENPTTSDKYDLVNTDSAANPIFGALKLRIAYGKSDDWTNDTTSAQPYTAISQTSYLSSSGSGNAAVLTANGTNVWDATAKTMKTTVTLGGNSGTETIAALVFSGSPRITYNDEILAPAVPSIAYAFELADGTEHVRRKIVDDAKCLACHAKVTFHGQGTVGGDLGVQTCVVCHNPNATDKSKRASVVTLFDGKDEESYDFKVMIHRIHSATENDNPYVVYRPNIYVFFGQTLPTDWTSGTGKTANRIYYPQELTNCEACHFSGTYSEAGSKALPVTIEQNDYTDRYDDTVIGATRAACASCHTGKLLSGTDASLQAHFKVSITKSDVGTDGGCAICHNGSYAPGH
ncbi:MAG: cytochrome c3 family protein [Geovibrio sp.]|nr:cytochrome c3 family protein [Geovibrio sp.]